MFFCRLNIPSNYSFEGKTPSLSTFEELLDSKERTLEKTLFVSTNQEERWNLKKELKKSSAYKTRVLAKSCLMFLRDSMDFQIKLLETLEIESNYILHPFTSNVTTLPRIPSKCFQIFI